MCKFHMLLNHAYSWQVIYRELREQYGSTEVQDERGWD